MAVSYCDPRSTGTNVVGLPKLSTPKRFRTLGFPTGFVQDNQSFLPPRAAYCAACITRWKKPQGKLIRVLSGSIWDVAVDLRRSSPTFGQWAGFHLSAKTVGNAVDSRRFRARISSAVGNGGSALQDDGFLSSCGRENHLLGRSDAGRRMAAGRVDSSFAFSRKRWLRSSLCRSGEVLGGYPTLARLESFGIRFPSQWATCARESTAWCGCRQPVDSVPEIKKACWRPAAVAAAMSVQRSPTRMDCERSSERSLAARRSMPGLGLRSSWSRPVLALAFGVVRREVDGVRAGSPARVNSARMKSMSAWKSSTV